MSFDGEARQSADALAAHLGREIQDRLQEFVSHLATAAADERQALTEQAQQAVTAAERTLEAAVLRAREETTLETTARLEAEQADRLAAAEREAADRHARESQAALAAAVAAAERDAVDRHARESEAALAAAVAAAERDATDRHTRESQSALAAAVAAAHSRGQATLERLVAAFRRLDEGQSLSQLLDILAEEASREASRCAVFVVRGSSLQGWAFSGFDDAPGEARGVTLSLDTVSELAQVVERGVRGEVPHTAFAASHYDDGPLAFMALGEDHAGVAVPVSVGGQVAALVYADEGADADRAGRSGSAGSGSPDAIELLARHAARCLEAQTAIRAARLSNSAGQASLAARGPVGVVSSPFGSAGLTPAGLAAGADTTYAEEHARRYARLLIADIRLHHEPAVRAGRDARDLWRRLQPEIAKARQSFDERVPPALLSRDRIFEEELVRTLADGDETLLGFETPGSTGSGSEGPEAERLAV